MKVSIKHIECPMSQESRDLAKKFIKFLNEKFPLKDDIVVYFLGERNGGMTTGGRTSAHELKILTKGRINRDILRTLAHEWVHEYQHGVLNREKGPDIGGQNEDEANAFAGRLMKMFEKDNPEYDGLIFEGLKSITNRLDLLTEQMVLTEKIDIQKEFITEMTKIGIEKLPYSYSALKKFVDPETMDIHYNKHYKGYVKKLNDALSSRKGDMELEDIIKSISKFDVKVRNNAGGAFNHALFWKMLSPKKQTLKGELLDKITKQYGSFKNFKEEFNKVALDRFGSGWAWLILTKNNKLKIMSTPNQDNPLMNVVEGGGYPLLGLDVWEHAYYLRYRNKRDQYINRFWNHINWEFVNDLYKLRTNKKETINESNNPKEKIILKWLDKKFGNLTSIINQKGIIKTFFDQNGIRVFFYVIQPPVTTIFINQEFWGIFQNVFNLRDYEIEPILKKWLKETYNTPNFKKVHIVDPNTINFLR